MNENLKKISNYPDVDDKNWLVFSVVAAIFILVLSGIGITWIFTAPTEESMMSRARILTPIGAFGVAIVTFLTVVWRGLVVTQQTKEQKRQNDSADENNMALLYLRGSELLTSDKSVDHRIGISVLRTVIGAQNDKYVVPAMDLLVNYIQLNHSANHDDPLFHLANDALKHGELERGQFSSNSELRFTRGATKNAFSRWYYVFGVKRLSYKGGEVGVSVSDEYVKSMDYLFSNGNAQITFVDCHIYCQKIGANWDAIAKNCNFEYCSFEAIQSSLLEDNILSFCDFSGCKISPVFRQDPKNGERSDLWYPVPIPDLKVSNNYVINSNFPITWDFEKNLVELNWSDYLLNIQNPEKLSGYDPVYYF